MTDKKYLPYTLTHSGHVSPPPHNIPLNYWTDFFLQRMSNFPTFLYNRFSCFVFAVPVSILQLNFESVRDKFQGQALIFRVATNPTTMQFTTFKIAGPILIKFLWSGI